MDGMSISNHESFSTGLISLSVHDELNSTTNSSFNGVQLAIRPDLFPDTAYDTNNNDGNKDNFKVDQHRPYLFLVEIRVWDKRLGLNMSNGGSSVVESMKMNQVPAGYDLRTSFTMAVTKESMVTIKSSSRTQVSLLKNVADLYGVAAYDMVTLTRIRPEDEANELAANCAAEFVTVAIKDQFVSRGDQFYFHNDLVGKWLYEGERLSTNLGVRATVNEIRKGRNATKLGIVTENTKITVRSRSSRIIWLVQISTEMWDYASPYETARQSQHGGTEGISQIYFDKFVRFMTKAFDRWKAIEATHSLTVVFFSRTYITNPQLIHNLSDRKRSSVYRDVDGRYYEDHYKIVIENETRTNWNSIVYEIKRAFIQFPINTGWNLSNGRFPSAAAQGNVLEAINVTLNLLQLHYMDRDLTRMGNSLVLISAGSGVFEVNRELAAITKQRMMDNGIGSDMLSLSLPPLHVSPFFLYKEFSGAEDDDSDWKTFVECPHWMHLSFVNYDYVTDPNDVESKPRILKDSMKKEISVGANGFVLKHPDPSFVRNYSQESLLPKDLKGNPKLENHPHMISGREFEDILEACRPRNRGDSIKAMPSALRASLGWKVVNHSDVSYRDNMGIMESGIDGLKDERKEKDHVGKNSDQTGNSSPIHEWGAVEIDSTLQLRVIPELEEKTSDSASVYSSNSFSFMSRSMELLESYLENSRHRSMSLGAEIQPTASLDKSMIIDSKVLSIDVPKNSKVDVGTSSLDEYCNILKQIMNAYDADLFIEDLGDTKKEIGSSVLNLSINKGQFKRDQLDRSLSDSRRNMIDTKILERSTNEGGGIGAALSQFISHSNGLKRIVSSKRLSKSPSLGHTLNKKGFQSLSGRRHVYSPTHESKLSPPFGPRPSTADPPDSLLGQTSQSALGSSSFDDSRSNGGFFIGSLQDSMHASQTSKASKPQYVSVSSVLSSMHNENASPTILATLKQSERPAVAKVIQPIKPTLSSERIHDRRAPAIKSTVTRRKAWVLNPFREQDEEHVLAEYSYSRLRWSHVFPLGEIEFKKKAGPNWKSLCQPAVLPMTIDHFPFLKELNDSSKFTFKHYLITLDAMDDRHYKSHTDLLKEMIVQRLIQNFQLVPHDVFTSVTQSIERRNKSGLVHTESTLNEKQSSTGTLRASRRSSDLNISGHLGGTGIAAFTVSNPSAQYALSMGHRIHILSYKESTEEIEVVQYQATATQKEHSLNTQCYRYLLWVPLAQKFQQVEQKFDKYEAEYRWNKLDNILCGDPENSLTEDSRYRRVSFGVIPPHDMTPEESSGYVTKFQRLLEYINKQLSNGDAVSVKFLDDELSSNNSKHTSLSTQSKRRPSARPLNRTNRYTIKLSRGREKYQWLNIVLDEVFSTKKTYHISFHWLVACGDKVEKQISLLQRRCSQYGLKLISLPQYSMSSNLYLHPLRSPVLVTINSKTYATAVERWLTSKCCFIDDGYIVVDATEVQHSNCFEFKIDRWGKKKLNARQYIHFSGCVFVRVLEDAKSTFGFFWIENRSITRDSQPLASEAIELFRKFNEFAAKKPIIASESETA